MHTRVMLVRHAERDKDQLSPKGEKDARRLGDNLPEAMRGRIIAFVGGSVQFRSIFTAMLIARGAGATPKVLASSHQLGSEEQLLRMTTMEAFAAAMVVTNNCSIAALRQVLSRQNYALLKNQLLEIVRKCGHLGETIILGTHSPWLQLFYEAIISKEYNGNASELDYVIVDVDQDGHIILAETNLPQP